MGKILYGVLLPWDMQNCLKSHEKHKKKNIIRKNTILSKLNQWEREVLNFIEKPHGDFHSKLPHGKKTPRGKYEF